MRISYIYWFALFGPDSPSVRYRALYPLKEFQHHYGIPGVMIVPGYSPSLLFFMRNCEAVSVGSSSLS